MSEGFPNRFDEALDKFAKLSTGHATSEDHSLLFEQVLRIPKTIEELDYGVGTWSEFSLDAEMRKDIFLRQALDHFNMFLNAARDGLVTVFAVVGQAHVVPSLSLSTLARQSLETVASALYIMDLTELEGVRTRGFAAAWKDLCEQEKFSRFAREGGFSSEEQLQLIAGRNNKRRQDLIQSGTKSGLLTKTKGKYCPVTTWPNITSLLQSVKLQSGTWDLRLTYSMLSGQSHGLSWAQLAGTKVTPIADFVINTADGSSYAGHSLTTLEPNSHNVGFALRVVQDIATECVLIKKQLASPVKI
jgi:hypothetical protein